MERIQLLTSSGHHVAYVEIVHFLPNSKPDIVMWGSRVFKRGPSDSYVEAFAVVSFTPSPGLAGKCPECGGFGDGADDEKAQCLACTKCAGTGRLDPNAPQPVDRTAQTTTDGRTVDAVRAEQQADGNKMHASYIVLTDEERAKGFVRPVRRSYRHVGIAAPGRLLRDLTDEEKARHERYGYVKFQPYPPSDAPVSGRYWTQAQLDAVGKGCGGVTTMGLAIAETYAREPTFYGSTMCVGCGKHFPVGASGEFVWDGTQERVGT